MSGTVIPFHHPKHRVEPGFTPYLVERLMPAAYRRIPAPDGLDGRELVEMALEHCRRTGRRMCVVLGPASCWYVEPDGSSTWSDDPPSGGVWIEGDSLE